VDELRFPHEGVELLPLGKLQIDRRVQRQRINKAHANDIARKFDPAGFRYLTVSRRDNGTYAVVDGHHRMTALVILGYGEGTPVPCDVRHGLTLQQEAVLFRLLNTMNKPMPLDSFLVRVVEGDPVANDINRITEATGWQIGTTSPGHVTAVDALERVYTGRSIRHSPKGPKPEALQATLQIVSSAWGTDSRGVAAINLIGIGAVYRRDGNAIDIRAIGDKLARFPGGPAGVIGKAKSIAVGGRNISNAVSFVVVQLYNQKRRAHSLPDWPLS
jgi:hypothetical protein